MNIVLVLVLVLVLGSSIDLLGEIVFDRVVLGDLPSGPKKMVSNRVVLKPLVIHRVVNHTRLELICHYGVYTIKYQKQEVFVFHFFLLSAYLSSAALYTKRLGNISPRLG
jgi:hypothetical protein